MWDFWKQRLKAIAGAAAPVVTVAILDAVCKVAGWPFPDDARTWVTTIMVSIVSGLAVHQTPNLKN